MWKKIIIIVTTIALVASSGLGLMTTSAQTKTRLTLADAIKVAKSSFPDQNWDDLDFNSTYVEWDGTPRWQLHWTDEATGEVYIVVQAENGRVLEYNTWSHSNEEGELAPLPKLAEAAALAEAEAFLKRLVPAEFALCRYQAGDPLRPYLAKRSRHLSYNFSFQRFANDIPFNFNGLKVRVNADTGAVMSYNYIWTEGPVPALTNIIDDDKAAAIAQDAGKMELQYYIPHNAKRGEMTKPILVYQAPKLNYLCVDALSGEIYAPLDQPLFGRAGLGSKEMADNSSTLSPAEQKEVALIEGLLRQAEAEQKARQVFKLQDNYKLDDASLTASWRNPEQRRWNLQFNDQDEGNAQQHVQISLDAATSEILHFYSSLQRDDFATKGNLDCAAAEKIASAYIKQINSSKARQVELVQPEKNEDQAEHKPLNYYFTYRRLINGIPCPQNGFTVNVYAGEKPLVLSYNLEWFDTKFPAATDSLSLEQAQTALRSAYPFHLEYRVQQQRQVQPLADKVDTQPIRLVYTQAPVPSTMFAAKTMTPLDAYGKVIEEDTKRLPTDIAGHPAEQDILFLAKVGILQVPQDGLYRPDEAATIKDWLELLANAAGSSSEQGIDKTIDTDKRLKREKLAYYAIRALGYEKIAALSSIFKIDAADATEVTPSYIGHLAIALELDLLQLTADKVAPQAAASRADLATTLMQMLAIER